MASIYVSYRSTEEPFVRTVVSKLDSRHKVFVDYHLRPGADWRSEQLAQLRAADAFVVFVSHDSAASDYQNAEIGGALAFARFSDGKLILPLLLDPVPPPRPLSHLDCVDVSARDPDATAALIEKAVEHDSSRIRLFVSHAHLDEDIARLLVHAIAANFEVPLGELRCTSVPDYQLDLGTKAPDVLRRELGSAACVIAVLTPNSLTNDWVLFELGSAWFNATVSIPLLAGGLRDRDIPGPLRGAAGGQLNEPLTLDRMIERLESVLGWRRRHSNEARQRCYDVVNYIQKHKFAEQVETELRASFGAKRAKIGTRQGHLLDLLTAKLRQTDRLPLDEVAALFGVARDNELYYRLEHLRLMGFLAKIDLDGPADRPDFAWALSPSYRQEIGA